MDSMRIKQIRLGSKDECAILVHVLQVIYVQSIQHKFLMPFLMASQRLANVFLRES